MSLTVDNLPAHTHNLYDRDWLPGGWGSGADTTGRYTFYTDAFASIPIFGQQNGVLGHGDQAYHATESTGNGQPFVIAPPYYRLAYIMRLY